MCFLTMEHGSTQKMNLRPIKLSPINKMTRTQLNYSPTPLLSSPTADFGSDLPSFSPPAAARRSRSHAGRRRARPPPPRFPGGLGDPRNTLRTDPRAQILRRGPSPSPSRWRPHLAVLSASCQGLLLLLLRLPIAL
jgi:hypothetical protein